MTEVSGSPAKPPYQDLASKVRKLLIGNEMGIFPLQEWCILRRARSPAWLRSAVALFPVQLAGQILEAAVHSHGPYRASASQFPSQL